MTRPNNNGSTLRFSIVIILCLLAWTNPTLVLAQSPTCAEAPTSATAILAASKSHHGPRAQLEYLRCCVEYWQYRAPDTAFLVCEKAIDLAQKHRETLALARLHWWRAWLCYYELPQAQNASDLSKADALISLDLSLQLNDALGITKAYSILAALDWGSGQPEGLSRNLANAERYLPDIKDHTADSLSAAAYLQLLKAASFAPDWDKVQAVLAQAQAIYTQLGDHAGLARTHKNMALYAWANGENSLGVLPHFQAAADHFAQCGSRNGLVSTLVRMGGYYTDLYTQPPHVDTLAQAALSTLHRALNLGNDIEVLTQLAVTHHHKAALASQQGVLPNASLDSVRFYYNAALDLVKMSENPADLNILSENIALVCPSMGDCDNWVKAVSQAAQSMLLQKQTRMKQAQQRLATFTEAQNAQRQRRFWITAGLILLGVVALAIMIMLQMRVRNLNRVLQAQLKLLQAQLTPHFVSNCMNAIIALIRKQELNDAKNYIVKFTRLCRNLLENSDDTTVALSKEIETLRYYLDLEKLRLRDQFDYDISADPGLDPEKIRIPLMLVQPFAENAIWHGIQHKTSPGTLRITFERASPELLRLVIEDDGIGRKKSQAIQSQSNREHRSWGMSISRQRIEAIQRMKGAAFHIEDLYPDAEETGTKVQITFKIIKI